MNKLRLFLLGFLTLFLELALIRYLGGTIWNLGYFPNLVLLAVFIGMGLGFTGHMRFNDRVSERLFRFSPYFLLCFLAFVIYFRPSVPGFSNLQADFGGDLYFNAGLVKDRLFDKLIFLFWFGMSVALFGLIAQFTAKLFRQMPPLTAYTMDIAGSLAGIIVFMAIGFWQVPAYLWFLGLLPLFLFAHPKPDKMLKWLLPPILLITGMVAYQDSGLLAIPNFKHPVESFWSPYQKVEYVNIPNATPHLIFVNGITHQSMESYEQMRHRFYQSVYDERARQDPSSPYKSVLIIGSGSGNDVATALGNGAKHVDAVEIDPAIAELGAKHHPDRPYSDPRVHLVIDDGRAFMSRTSRKYDLIIFALTDSVVKVSPVSQLRLENYLFTVDAVQKASRLLNDNGDLIFYNWYRQDWLLTKLMQMMALGMQRTPQILYQKGHFFILKVSKLWPHQAADQMTAAPANLATDDWPFLYLKERRIPPIYAAGMGIVLLFIILWGAWLYRQERQHANYNSRQYRAGLRQRLIFFSMGVAFLLLETKSVIQFSLLFGTTWFNSSLVFLGVLSLVLAANALAVKIPRNYFKVIFGLLLISALLPLAYPLSNLLAVESLVLRYLFASMLTFTPIFFANLLFSVFFRDAKLPEQLFGWNLIGAALGGLLEYISMLLGYNALALLIAAAYLIAFILAQSKPGKRRHA